MSEKSKGTLCGIVAAVSYGMNPLGALSLYRAGINTNSVLFYRYALAAVLLAALLLVQKTSLRITRREFSVLGLLGVMFAVSSLTLFMSFHYMDAGIASTLLFVYPVMVAVIMAIFFRERISLVTVLSISLALIPTVVSLVLMTVAVHAIGSTPTAVMGALEPLTAVVIGVTIFGELFTARLAAGIGLILLAVTLIVAGKSLHPGRLAAIIGHRGFLRHSR